MDTQRRNLLKTYLHVQNLNVIGRFRHDNLLARFGSLEDALKASANDLKQVSGISSKIAAALKQPRDEPLLEKELARIEKGDLTIVLLNDDEFPSHLKTCDDSPLLLLYQGEFLKDDEAAMAIVGSRNCSAYGQRQAYQFAHALAQKGITIISGLARGIDSAAHRGALDAGGRTLAIQGCGLKYSYPASSKRLSQEIKKAGAVVTELLWDAPPLPYQFPRRNRIISGLSLGTLVIEAHQKSGSLITARWAVEQNRDVFAIPGPIDSEASYGCHQLIQDGAKLVTSPSDILDEFPSLTRSPIQESKIPRLTPEQKKILSLICEGHQDFNTLLMMSGLSPGTLSLHLFKLENSKLLKAQAGKRWIVADRIAPALARELG